VGMVEYFLLCLLSWCIACGTVGRLSLPVRAVGVSRENEAPADKDFGRLFHLGRLSCSNAAGG
jgi:hypothetical protein